MDEGPLMRLAVQEGQNARSVAAVVRWLDEHGLIDRRREYRECLECRRLFVVHDARQRYCSERCAGRDRGRRLRERRRAGISPTPRVPRGQPRLPLL